MHELIEHVSVPTSASALTTSLLAVWRPAAAAAQVEWLREHLQCPSACPSRAPAGQQPVQWGLLREHSAGTHSAEAASRPSCCGCAGGVAA